MVVAHLNCASGSRGSAESLSRDCDEDEDDEVLSLSSTAGKAALDDDDDDEDDDEEEEEEEEEDADEEENDAPNKPSRWYKPYAPPAKQPGPEEAEARRKPRERRESNGNDMLCYV